MLMTTRHLFCAVLLAIAGAGAMTSCTSGGMDTADVIDSAPQEAVQRAQVRLVCNVPTVTTAARSGAVTRAALTANGKAMTDIYILDYNKATGALLQVLHQTSTAADFAEPTITMDYGEHVLRVLATRSESPTLLDADSAPWSTTANVLRTIDGMAPVLLTFGKTSDTFGAETDITVRAGMDATASVTLERMVAKLVIDSTDDFPADASTIDLALDEYKAVQWQDFSVIDPQKNHRIVDVSGVAGQTGTTITYFFLAPTDGYNTDMTITTYGASGKEYSTITLTGVPLERNKVTTITGSLYGHQSGFQVSLNDAWNSEGHDINI